MPQYYEFLFWLFTNLICPFFIFDCFKSHLDYVITSKLYSDSSLLVLVFPSLLFSVFLILKIILPSFISFLFISPLSACIGQHRCTTVWWKEQRIQSLTPHELWGLNSDCQGCGQHLYWLRHLDSLLLSYFYTIIFWKTVSTQRVTALVVGWVYWYMYEYMHMCICYKDSLYIIQFIHRSYRIYI